MSNLRRRLAPLLVLTAGALACGSSGAPPASPAAVGQPNVTRRAVAEAVEPSAKEPHAAPPPALAARIGAAMKSVALFEGDFAGLSSFRPCVLVFGPEHEYVFQCPGLAGAAGFRAGGPADGDTAVFSAPTFTLPGTSVPFEKVRMIVGRAGGNVPLPNDKGEATPTPFFLVQDLDSLHDHHPAFKETSAEEWTAIFVHEYLHVFQFGQADVAAFVKEWPKEWSQRDVHSKFFAETPAYREVITAEVAILQRGLEAPTSAGSKAILAKWLAARDRRMKSFGPAFEKATGKAGFEQTDSFFTFLEGMARYLEVRFLCDRSLARPDLSGDPTFQEFVAFAGCSATKVDGRDRINGDFHYVIGALVSAHLDAANPGWKKTAFGKPGFLVDEARRSSR